MSITLEDAPAGSRVDRAVWTVTDAMRSHWVLGLLMVAGFGLRVLAQFGYQPALLFIDSNKYIFGSDFMVNHWGRPDPLGYTLLVLRPVLKFASLGLVALLQHLLGLAMAGALYLLMLRQGVTRWLAAVAVAPVLLDAYQLQAEQTIMPDVLFEALIVAGLVLLLWPHEPELHFVILGALMLGMSAPVRQVGEVLIVPGLVYVLAAAAGWRRRLLYGSALTVCFALPSAGYMTYSGVIRHEGFELSSMGDAYLYGRTAHAADCATLNIAPAERPLCPAPPVAEALGVDGLVNNPRAPRQTYSVTDLRTGKEISTQPLQVDLAYNVIRQQPMRVAGDIVKDVVKIFALTRNTQEGDTPVSRWQFQESYPIYPPSVPRYGATSPDNVFRRAGGGKAHVYRPAAIMLRTYQLDGGYVPGLMFLLALVTGTAGILTYRRHSPPGAGQALACLLLTGVGVAVLLGADLYEFSWRYQLPALVTLPVAGALGATAIVRRSRPPGAASKDRTEGYS